MKEEKEVYQWTHVIKSGPLKSSLGLFVAYSVIWSIFWGTYLPVYISIPIIIIYIYCVVKWIKIIFDIDKRLKTDKNFRITIQNESKTIKKFTTYFVFIIIGSFLLLFALAKTELEHVLQMRVFSFITIVTASVYLYVYWVYYKYYFLPKNH